MPAGLEAFQSDQIKPMALRWDDPLIKQFTTKCPQGWFIIPTDQADSEMKKNMWTYSKPHDPPAGQQEPDFDIPNGFDSPDDDDEKTPRRSRRRLLPDRRFWVASSSSAGSQQQQEEETPGNDDETPGNAPDDLSAIRAIDFVAACRHLIDGTHAEMFKSADALYRKLENPTQKIHATQVVGTEMPEWVFVMGNLFSVKGRLEFFGFDRSMDPHTVQFDAFKRILRGIGMAGTRIVSASLLPEIEKRATSDEITAILRTSIDKCNSNAGYSLKVRMIALCSLYKFGFWRNREKIANTTVLKHFFSTCLKSLIETAQKSDVYDNDDYFMVVCNEYMTFISKRYQMSGKKRSSTAQESEGEELDTDSDPDSDHIRPPRKQARA